MGAANLLTFPEAFDNAAWLKSAILSVTADATTDPFGGTRADLIIPTAATAQHFVRQNYGGRGNVERQAVVSVYLKAAGYTTATIYCGDGTGFARAAADLTGAGSITSATVVGSGVTNDGTGIQSVGNGWYRVWSIATLPSTTTASWAYVFPNQNSSYLGDGTSGVYAWGAQLEFAASPTPYVDPSSPAPYFSGFGSGFGF